MLEPERSSVRGHAEFTEAQRGEGVCPRLMGSGRSETKIQAHGRRPALSLLNHWAGRNHSSVLPHCRPLKHCGCSYPQVGSSPGEPSFPFRSLPHGKKASRSPPSRHGWRVENGGNRPAQLLPGGVPGLHTHFFGMFYSCKLCICSRLHRCRFLLEGRTESQT